MNLPAMQGVRVRLRAMERGAIRFEGEGAARKRRFELVRGVALGVGDRVVLRGSFGELLIGY